MATSVHGLSVDFRSWLQSPGADPEIFKRGGALCRPLWLAGEENFRFQMV